MVHQREQLTFTMNITGINMKKCTKRDLFSTLEMLQNKKGAGVSKETKINLEIMFKGSIYDTTTAISTIQATLMAIKNLNPQMFYVAEVETEMENNPSWEKGKIYA